MQGAQFAKLRQTSAVVSRQCTVVHLLAIVFYLPLSITTATLFDVTCFFRGNFEEIEKVTLWLKFSPINLF